MRIVFLICSFLFTTTSFANEFDLESYNKYLENQYSLFMHKRSFFAPFSYNGKTHNEIYSEYGKISDETKPYYENIEAEYQISFFMPFMRQVNGSNWDLNIAYTQRAWWQIYNSSWSKQFRETNYTPEIFGRHIFVESGSLFSMRLVALDLGYMHQSNGQVDFISRTWDRVFARAYWGNEESTMSLAVWAQVPESASKRENDDILRYIGIGELTLSHAFGFHTVEAKIPLSVKPGIELLYSYPWTGRMRWFMSVNSGYGQNLIEYNKEVQRVALGITLENFMDKK